MRIKPAPDPGSLFIDIVRGGVKTVRHFLFFQKKIGYIKNNFTPLNP